MKKAIPILCILCLFVSVANAQFSSNLPIIQIETNGFQISDEPKIAAQMTISYNGAGKTTTLTDKPTVYNGKIGIEYRGSSSQSFPKKPYGIELWNSKNEDTTASILGWPKEADYVLFTSYNEKSLMHNALTMRIAREMGMYASRTHYVELFLNGQYEGVYVLMEKVKRDKGRVDIEKLEPDENTGNDLTGGYIIKIDKGTGTNYGSWFSAYRPIGSTANARIEYFYEYPSKEITSAQQSYIQKYVGDFETSLQGNQFTDPLVGYRSYIDTKSFIRFMLVNEVSRNIDGYRISTYLHKENDPKGGKLRAGPVWDFDISYGNADYCDGKRYDLFAYKFNEICSGDYWLVPFWWQRFLKDPSFVAELRAEYDALRKDGILQTDKLMAVISDFENELKQPQKRNFERWPILGQYVWPSPAPIASSWEGEVEELRQWLKNRLDWLDNNLPKPMALLPSEPTQEMEITALPNPFLDEVSVKITVPKSMQATIYVRDALGRIISEKSAALTEGTTIISLDFRDKVQVNNVFLVELYLDNQRIVKKLIRQ